MRGVKSHAMVLCASDAEKTKVRRPRNALCIVVCVLVVSMSVVRTCFRIETDSEEDEVFFCRAFVWKGCPFEGGEPQCFLLECLSERSMTFENDVGSIFSFLQDVLNTVNTFGGIIRITSDSACLKVHT